MQQDLDNNLSDIKVELAEIRKDLNEHMRRCDVLEEIVADSRKFIDETRQMMKFANRLLIVVAGGVGLVSALLQILDYFK